LKSLFKTADKYDCLLLAIGVLSALVHGASIPLSTVFFGDVINSFTLSTAPSDAEGALSPFRESIKEIVLKLALLGVVATLASFLQLSCLMVSGQRQAHKIRKGYIRSLLSQDVAFYDRSDTGELTTRLSGFVFLFIFHPLASPFPFVQVFVSSLNSSPATSF